MALKKKKRDEKRIHSKCRLVYKGWMTSYSIDFIYYAKLWGTYQVILGMPGFEIYTIVRSA